jgi:hypothetical protein
MVHAQSVRYRTDAAGQNELAPPRHSSRLCRCLGCRHSAELWSSHQATMGRMDWLCLPLVLLGLKRPRRVAGTLVAHGTDLPKFAPCACGE